jgi:predicted AAA+ superfamily ATPase
MTNKELLRQLPPPAASFFLFGLRGSGKSAWARRHYPDARRIDLLDEALFQDLLGNPALFAAGMGDLRPRDWVVVDEVQRLPSLLNEVHRLIEERRLRFALLGSSARKLKSAGTNLLAGRAVRCEMFPLTPAELGSGFSLSDALRFGTLALVHAASDRKAALEAYVQLYLREEIRAEALVRNLPGFVRFLPIAALFHGQTVNVSAIARDCGVSRTTVQGYLEILGDTLLTWTLPAYEAKLRVRERKHPKLYWTDAGVVRAAKRQLGALAIEERGPLFEGWVLHLLRAQAQIAELYDTIHYWAPAESASTEVDFLLRRGREALAIEVKAGARFQERMVIGLRAIADLPRIARRILVYGGDRYLKLADGIEVWPHGRLVSALAADNLWP